MEHLKFPVGRFIIPEIVSQEELHGHIANIQNFPSTLFDLVSAYTDEDLDTAYRPDGWTARQVVHHLADSHCHALIRFKWSLTEDNPTIKPYNEAKNALLADYELPVAPALEMLKGIHDKWTSIMQNLENDDWYKGYFHPVTGKFFRLDQVAAMYEWHGRHHIEHIKLCNKKI